MSQVTQVVGRNPLICSPLSVVNASKSLVHLPLIRGFHSTPCCAGSSILNLSGLSTSRESRFLSKERGIPRTEFSPHLELIRSSEVEPFTGKKASSTANATPNFTHGQINGGENPLSVGHLIKELDATRLLQAETQKTLQDLQARYKSRERDTVNLAFVTVMLILGIVNASALTEMAQPVLQRFRNVQEDAYARYGRYISRSSAQGQQSSCSGSMQANGPNDAVSTASMHDQHVAPAWLKRLFWASPD